MQREKAVHARRTARARSPSVKGAKADRRPVHRSPQYPGISLETALSRLRKIYEVEKGFHPTPASIVIGYWGYHEKTSDGRRSLATLMQFGLLEPLGRGDEKDVQVSEIGKTLLLESNTVESRRALQAVALRPAIHRALWEKWRGHLASDEVMKAFLMREHHFTPMGAEHCIRVWRSTFAFAKLGEGDNLGEDAPFEPKDEILDGPAPATARSGPVSGQVDPKSVVDIPIPLSNGQRAVLRIPTPISEGDYELIRKAVVTNLDLFKKSFVRQESPEAERRPAKG